VTPSRAIEDRPIFLIGFMGAGKSTVGRLLADRLGRAFVDLDERIASEAQATIPELFAEEGEAGFRRREAALLAEVIAEGAQVVAPGGGAPCHGDNLERMLASGVVAYLSSSVDEILARVGAAADRPLLAGPGDRRATVERLLQARQAHYQRAHFTVETSGIPPSQVVARLIAELGA
jgi:shikimate kinase